MAAMVLLVMWPDGKEPSPRIRSDSSERRTTGFLKIDMNSGRPFSSRPMRTEATCFGRLRLIADFNVFVIGSAMRIGIANQKIQPPPLNPPKITPPKTTRLRAHLLPPTTPTPPSHTPTPPPPPPPT